MSVAYRVKDNSKAYFITTSIVGWIDVFTRPIQKESMLTALQYCQQEKGLDIFAWCLMSNHLHLLCRSKQEELALSGIIRDLKTFTSKQIIRNIKEETESRREWMLEHFAAAGRSSGKPQRYKVWQAGYHAEEIHNYPFMEQKINYIHQNPVKAGIVEKPEDYLYSSARNYAGEEALMDIVKVDLSWKTP
jgi:REP element-mobilizing transposase RayT